jgi:hypothetical protein
MNINREKLKQSLKYGSIIIGILLFVMSFFGLFLSVFNPKTFLLHFYSIIFGVLIIFGELGWYKKLFGFLNTYFGRGLFEIFIGISIIFQDWSGGILSKILGVFCLLFGIGQLLFSCDKNPEENNNEDPEPEPEPEQEIYNSEMIDPEIEIEPGFHKAYDDSL